MTGTAISTMATNVAYDLSQALERPSVRGKFLFVGDRKLYIRGVTYGTFRPDENGDEYPAPNVVEQDFKHMAGCGINTVRTYTMPPLWLLEIAQRYGLRLMVSLAIERFIGYLADNTNPPQAEGQLRQQLRKCSGHPAILCYAIGNEIPAASIRWLGKRRVERYLKSIYDLIKSEDPTALVTYVNYPTAEYLELPFLDIVCFNVYLENVETFQAYLAQLHNVAGDRPLLMSEIGLDCIRSSEQTQARVLEWQVRTSFTAGCAGVFVYSWTDEWHRGGEDVHDWAFGLVRRDRSAKPALAAVSRAFEDVPFAENRFWPLISVVVCSYNGSGTIRSCCEGLKSLSYPRYEVIVVDDGSTDGTSDTARAYGFRVIRTVNCGLSHARNLGWKAAKGDIVAYLDDDAYPDPHWLHYLAATFEGSNYAGVGGPNLQPGEGGLIAHCIANSPGGPTHVLLTDTEAEHIPGCNFAFRKDVLEAIGGFDAQFRVAGDDVDICWRIQERGWKLGFSPAALVWHHRRNSIRRYWRQQWGYGKAEAMLEAKWPDKYNLSGHVSWTGRLYNPVRKWSLGGWRIYHGVWGTAPFQRLYENPGSMFRYLPFLPEWHLITLALLVITIAGLFWTPFLRAAPLVVAIVALPLMNAIRAASAARLPVQQTGTWTRLKFRIVIAFLHLTQPFARLDGRLHYGLSPWRRRGGRFAMPRSRTIKFWTDQWRSTEERLRIIDARLRADRNFVSVGGEFDNYDLQVKGGLLGGGKLLAAVEEQGGGCQTVRYRVWPSVSRFGLLFIFGHVPLGVIVGLSADWTAAALLGLAAIALAVRMWLEASAAMGALLRSIEK